MSTSRIVLYILVMAGVTYLIRMLPLTIFQKKIQSTYIRSFLFYVPYAVLGAMTFPTIFFSTGMVASALVGTTLAVILAFYKKGLLTVALCACAAAFLVERLLALLG